MSDGFGCKCMARSAGECCCNDVDWTPQELIDLRAENAALKAPAASEPVGVVDKYGVVWTGKVSDGDLLYTTPPTPLIEAARMALEAMKEHGTSYLNHEDQYAEALSALRNALEKL